MAAGTATVAIHAAKEPGKEPAKDSQSAFPGYATPEAAFQSLIWALGTGDLEKVQACFTPEQTERSREKMRGKSDAEVRRFLQAGATMLGDYQITQKEVMSNDEVRLHLQVQPSAEHPQVGNDVQVMRRIGNDWKYAGKYGVDIK